MDEIMYSNQFYVNDFPNKDREYAKQFIEAFMKKPPKKLFDYLATKNQFGKLKPEFQAAIIGEPKTSLFGQPQAAILLVHSNFIAYTTNPDYASPVGLTYGYATFDNELSVTMDGDQLAFKMPYETIIFGVHSLSKTEDFRVLNELIEQNISSIHLFNEVMPKREEKSIQTVMEQPEEAELHGPVKTPALVETDIVPVPLEEDQGEIFATEDETAEVEELESAEVFVNESTELAETHDEAMVMEGSIEPMEAAVSESTPLEGAESLDSEAITQDLSVPTETETIGATKEDAIIEWGHTEMEEHSNSENEEKDSALLEEERQSIHQEVKQADERNKTAVDPRFRTKQPIISNNSIPDGFVYAEPVIYVNSVRPGIFKSSTAKNAYLKAYDACLQEILEEIDAGRFDAVFNLQLTTQSVESYYDVVVTGDAVVYDRH